MSCLISAFPFTINFIFSLCKLGLGRSVTQLDQSDGGNNSFHSRERKWSSSVGSIKIALMENDFRWEAKLF